MPEAPIVEAPKSVTSETPSASQEAEQQPGHQAAKVLKKAIGVTPPPTLPQLLALTAEPFVPEAQQPPHIPESTVTAEEFSNTTSSKIQTNTTPRDPNNPTMTVEVGKPLTPEEDANLNPKDIVDAEIIDDTPPPPFRNTTSKTKATVTREPIISVVPSEAPTQPSQETIPNTSPDTTTTNQQSPKAPIPENATQPQAEQAPQLNTEQQDKLKALIKDLPQEQQEQALTDFTDNPEMIDLAHDLLQQSAPSIDAPLATESSLRQQVEDAEEEATQPEATTEQKQRSRKLNALWLLVKYGLIPIAAAVGLITAGGAIAGVGGVTKFTGNSQR
jgi:hypothetical protein